MAQMKAGQAVIEALRAEGVEYTFGVVGTTTNSIVTEMYRIFPANFGESPAISVG
jgi:thiamine pyrophosphate-dependent acetolactate synthase large subunit-like protein